MRNHTHTYTRLHTWANTHIYTHIHAHTHTRAHTYTHTHTHIHALTHTHIHTHTRAHTRTRALTHVGKHRPNTGNTNAFSKLTNNIYSCKQKAVGREVKSVFYRRLTHTRARLHTWANTDQTPEIQKRLASCQTIFIRGKQKAGGREVKSVFYRRG